MIQARSKLNFSGQARACVHNARCAQLLGGSGGMPPQEILAVLRSILVHFGTLVHHGKVHVQINYAAGIIVDFRMSSMACLETQVVTCIRYTCCARARKTTP